MTPLYPLSYSAPRFGHTFQFVPYSSIDRHPKTRLLVLKGHDMTKRIPEFIKPSNRLVGHPFTIEQTKATSRPMYSPDAVVCTIFRYGSDRGKQRIGHLDPNYYGVKPFEQLVAMMRHDIQAYRDLQRSKKPYIGALIGGMRGELPSEKLKEAIAEAFRLERIPFSKI
jgi:hypothetical protein